jgi:pimeloyl-ACP methyl ester carboxylesterase
MMDFSREEIRLASGTVPYFVAGTGRPLLHLHSTGGFQPTEPLQALAQHHRVLAPIVPGFDGTPAHAGVRTITDVADLVAAFADQAIGAPCDVIGHSFGGYVALWLALRHPQLVEQLVLEAPAGLRFGADGSAPPAGPYAHPERAAAFAKSPELLERNRRARDGYGTGQPVDAALKDRIGEVKARTLILFGTADRMIPRETGVFLKAQIRASHLAYVYDAGHAIEVDQPERFLRVVASYLERGEAYIVNRGTGREEGP